MTELVRLSANEIGKALGLTRDQVRYRAGRLGLKTITARPIHFAAHESAPGPFDTKRRVRCYRECREISEPSSYVTVGLTHDPARSWFLKTEVSA
jgi:hypothetical protein